MGSKAGQQTSKAGQQTSKPDQQASKPASQAAAAAAAQNQSKIDPKSTPNPSQIDPKCVQNQPKMQPWREHRFVMILGSFLDHFWDQFGYHFRAQNNLKGI